MRRLAVATIALSLVGIVACDDSDEPKKMPMKECSEETRAETYVSGMHKKSGDHTITLVNADPGPPEREDNVWELEISTSAGPMEGATVSVTSWMPDHGHGSAVDAVVTEEGTAGSYVVDPVHFQMAGFWEVTVKVEASGIDESVVFGFCIES